ncbi:MAG: pentapeptide repeat-containing protein [Planctomycetota bacterium]
MALICCQSAKHKPLVSKVLLARWLRKAQRHRFASRKTTSRSPDPFDQINLSRCDFETCDLTGTGFDNAIVDGVRFRFEMPKV